MNTSLESVVTILRRSGLVDEAAITDAVAAVSQGSAAPTGEALLEYLISKELITPWQASKLLVGKHKGFFLGKYRLQRLLGKGGMSSVYLAEHVLMRRRCAIKVLPWKLVKDSSYLQRFHREAQAVASLDHPNIVRAYDVDQEKDGNVEIHFLVMEYVEGSNLFDLVQQFGPLSPAVAAEYLRQGALGLEHAHRAGMVHRDVKPGNFIVDQNGVVKLMDLGLARVAAQEDHSLTVAHDERVLGTADYLAPEQAVDSHLVDARADIYSLGCTLYFLLSGRPPFNEGTLTQRLLAHQTKEPTPLETLRNDVPESLLQITRGMMKKDREERIQSASEVVELLTRWQEAGGSAAVSVSPPERPRVENAGKPMADTAVYASQTAKAPDHPGGIGNFLSSLSDIDTEAGNTPVQPGSGRRQGTSQTIKIDREKTVEPEHESLEPAEEFLEPATDDDPFAIASGFGSGGSGVSFGSGKSAGKSSGKLAKGSGRPTISNDRKSTSRGQRKSGLESFLPPELLEKVVKNKIPLAIGGGVLTLLFVLGAIYAFTGPSEKAKVTPEPATVQEKKQPVKAPVEMTPPEKARPKVDGPIVIVGPTGHFGTIAEAIQYVRTSNSSSLSTGVKEIHLAGDQTLSEAISIDNAGLGGFPRQVKIMGLTEKPPRLQPAGTGPVILLNSVEELTIENVVVDCDGRMKGVELRGFMSGTTLKNVTFDKIQNVGLSGVGVSGIQNLDLKIESCLFQGAGSSATGILFDASTGSDTREVIVQQNRFAGPMGTGMALQGTGSAVDFSQNRFKDVSVGVQFSGSEQHSNQIRFINNTFFNGQYGIDFSSGPAADSKAFVFDNNLFVKLTGTPVNVSRTEATLAALIQGGAARFNWTSNAEVPSAGMNIFQQNGSLGKEVEFASEEVSSGEFLKPKSPDLRAPDSPGAFKFIGAVAP
ncbi:lipopolysaccharide core heptose(II) kinase RfaY [Planctomicrobium sp. SH527]|uniref:lipopolysaccharide core heptose(II) kinase RfaY n=1 Tax=Planctomicrobium sp. SH527 TaxID=3448123 RepID=UPI003F5B0E62